MTVLRRDVSPIAVMFALLLALPARAEIADSPKNQVDQADRYKTAKFGKTVEAWASHLNDKDPEARLEAVRLLGESADPQANQYLIEAVDNSDARVAPLAIDYLGRVKAKDAVPVLSERLFLKGTNAVLNQHILVALGRIGDPDASQRILDFVQGETDPRLRSTAIRVLGEIGSQAIGTDLRKLSEHESDSQQRTLMQDAAARIAARATDAAQGSSLPNGLHK